MTFGDFALTGVTTKLRSSLGLFLSGVAVFLEGAVKGDRGGTKGAGERRVEAGVKEKGFGAGTTGDDTSITGDFSPENGEHRRRAGNPAVAREHWNMSCSSSLCKCLTSSSSVWIFCLKDFSCSSYPRRSASQFAISKVVMKELEMLSTLYMPLSESSSYILSSLPPGRLMRVEETVDGTDGTDEENSWPWNT